jgi:hypothetical protein
VTALRAAIGMLAALALAGSPRVEAQVVIGGIWMGFAVFPVAPIVLVPIYPYPYGIYPYPDLRFSDDLPACYRFGRCSLRDLVLFRDRPHRLERLAPAAPDDVPRFEPAVRRPVAPTPEENILPEYRDAGVPRAEFSESGQPR